jgi:hypothetical protein
VDRVTFCTFFFNACLKRGHVDPQIIDQFVRDCAEHFPTIIDEFVEVGGATYGWEFNGDFKVAAEHDIPSSRNFMVWRKAKATKTPNNAGQTVLQKVTDNLSEDKCDRFGGTPGVRRIEEPGVEVRLHLGLLRTIPDKIAPGATIWDSVIDYGKIAAWGAATAAAAVGVGILIADDWLGIGALDDWAIPPIAGLCTYAANRFHTLFAH